MIRLIACSADIAAVGEITIGTMWHPWEGKYVEVSLCVIRICTEQEYLDFCDANNLPVRNEILKDAPHYYEIEIMD